MLQVSHFITSKGVCHRDLKLSNILVDDNYDIKVGDFGIAASVDGKDGYGLHKTYVGTKSYMAPEIIAR
jgi:serine/threonine protein kinase